MDTLTHALSGALIARATAPKAVAPAEVPLAQELWRQPQLAFFRWFAEYPVLCKVETGGRETCAGFQDLRCLTPGRASCPFRYGMCREGAAQRAPFELVGESARLPVYYRGQTGPSRICQR